MHQLARMKRNEANLVKNLQLEVTAAMLTAAATSQSIDFSEALPAYSHVLSVGIVVITPFDDGSTGVFTADLGISGGDADAFLDGVDIEAAGYHATPQGVQPSGMVGGITPAILIDAGAVNVNTAIAGLLRANVLYAVGRG